MAVVVPFGDPSDYGRILRTIRRIWAEGTVEYGPHAIKAMGPSGLTALDIESVLLNGSIIEHNRPRENWRWKVQGACVDGGNASCVVEIELDAHLIIVTAIDERKPPRRRRKQ